MRNGVVTEVNSFDNPLVREWKTFLNERNTTIVNSEIPNIDRDISDVKFNTDSQLVEIKEGNTMETKSRYEVISDLENKKRELIRERDGLADQLLNKEKSLKNMERQKEDHLRQFERNLDDTKADIENFKTTMNERKETINQLIEGVNESLERLGRLTKEK